MNIAETFIPKAKLINVDFFGQISGFILFLSELYVVFRVLIFSSSSQN